MELRLACVGKLREPFLRDGAEHYARRLKPYARLELREVKPGPAELAGLEKALAGCRLVYCLDRQGEEVDSEGLARKLAAAMDRGQVPLGFAVGGADGIPASFLKPLAFRLSFSRLTFPHELFRLLLLEQLYRAFTILRGEPYHSGH